MPNVAMKRKLDTGAAIDVGPFKREGGYYVVPADKFDADADYCDAAITIWIWSIGRRRSDGVILASTKSDLYQNPHFECLWLR